MARLSEIESFGKMLQDNIHLDSLTTTQLHKMLKRYTNAFTLNVLSNYVRVLKEKEFIEFQNDGRWHIKRVNKTLF